MDILQTDLRIYKKGSDRVYIPIGASSGCSQTLSLLSSCNITRSIEGVLSEIKTIPVKYESKIRYTDEKNQYAIAFEGLTMGDILIVECVQRLVSRQISAPGEIKLDKKPVKGSVWLHDKNGSVKPLPKAEQAIKLTQEDLPCIVSYRPVLEMVLIEMISKHTEWGDDPSMVELCLQEV